MFDDDRRGASLGLWLLVVAAVAGLFLLLLQPSARADELDATTRILRDRSLASADDRLGAAGRLLDQERLRKSRGLLRLLFHQGL